MIGDVLIGPTTNDSAWQTVLNAQLDAIRVAQLKAFPQVTAAPSMLVGCESLMMTAGLGGLSPNTVVMPLPSNDALDEDDDDDDLRQSDGSRRAVATVQQLALRRIGRISDDATLVSVMQSVLHLQKNVVLACNFGSQTTADMAALRNKKNGSTADVWIPGYQLVDDWATFCGTSLLQMQLAWVLMRHKSKIRLYRELADERISVDDERARLVEIVKRQGRFRVGSGGDQIEVLRPISHGDVGNRASINADDNDTNSDDERVSDGIVMQRVRTAPTDVAYYADLNALVRSRCTNKTGVVLLPLPPLPRSDENNVDAAAFMQLVRALIADLPPCLLIAASDEEVMSTSI